MFPWNKKKGGGLDNCKIMYSTVQYSFISLYFFIFSFQAARLYCIFLRVGLGYSSPGFLKVCHRFYLDMLRRILFGGDCLYGYLTLTCETFKHG